MSENLITDYQTDEPCPFTDGQKLVINWDCFRGRTVQVDGSYCFWSRQEHYFGDPTEPVCTPEGWQIVVNVESEEGNGDWLYLLRMSAAELQRVTRPINQEGA